MDSILRAKTTGLPGISSMYSPTASLLRTCRFWLVELKREMGILNAVVTIRTSPSARMAMASTMPMKATSAALGRMAAPFVFRSGAQEGDGYFECGRNNSNITFGTDGDGVNDADEGNICGPWANGGAVCVDTYSADGLQTNMVIAGNYFNADIHGNSLGANLGGILNKAVNTTTLRFGSDFNGVSDALEGNLVFNELLFLFDSSWPTDRAWVSMRGNKRIRTKGMQVDKEKGRIDF